MAEEEQPPSWDSIKARLEEMQKARRKGNHETVARLTAENLLEAEAQKRGITVTQLKKELNQE